LPVVCNAGPHNSESDEGHIVPKKTSTGRRVYIPAKGGGQGMVPYWWCSYYIIKNVWIILISNYELWKREKYYVQLKENLANVMRDIISLCGNKLVFGGRIWSGYFQNISTWSSVSEERWFFL